jgi:hypothetical protein
MKSLRMVVISASLLLAVSVARADMVSGATFKQGIATVQSQIQSAQQLSITRLKKQRVELSTLISRLQVNVQQQLTKQNKSVANMTASVQKQFQAQDQKMMALQKQLLGEIQALQQQMEAASSGANVMKKK